MVFEEISMRASNVVAQLFRKKTFARGAELQSELKRCLGPIEVMFIAVGQMVGAGLYVLAGTVIFKQTGPSVILSFLCAGFAALMSAFSYAEFGARFPRAGSAYTYTYIGIGELWAFGIGWTVILELMIGNAAVARSWSGYLDALTNRAISNYTLETLGTLSSGEGFFGRYPDVLSFALICVTSVIVALGSKSSAGVNAAFVILNLLMIAFISIYGLTFANFSLWVGTDEDGKSRFFPFGIGGTLSGAATCFFAFVGFEALASAGEEAKNPRRTIPIATFGSLGLVTFVYVLTSGTLALMLPYKEINPDAAFSDAFSVKGATVSRYIITVGALAGMFNNLLSGLFSLPRYVYAMADDGLLFVFLATISRFTKVPLNAIFVFTILNAAIALIFDLETLVEFLSIGTLSAYSMVSVCVLILRHQAAPIDGDPERLDTGGRIKRWVPFRNFWESLPNGRSIVIAVASLIFGYFWLAFTIRSGVMNSIPGYISLGLSILFTILAFIFICGHEQNSLELYYRVPFVPFIPSLGLLINCFMMAFLEYLTWIRFFIWMLIGKFSKIFLNCFTFSSEYSFTHEKDVDCITKNQSISKIETGCL
ncbi:unnamed protein product [Haemonchus placei]|uniref:AA_permease_C domain-containing protein n=1 Tax=Haemonchus placei TaxID=6290 RepID=A0A0N4W585_HAEPC|nr:unnamed protein product [Haemonchus placei]